MPAAPVSGQARAGSCSSIRISYPGDRVYEQEALSEEKTAWTLWLGSSLLKCCLHACHFMYIFYITHAIVFSNTEKSHASLVFIYSVSYLIVEIHLKCYVAPANVWPQCNHSINDSIFWFCHKGQESLSLSYSGNLESEFFLFCCWKVSLYDQSCCFNTFEGCLGDFTPKSIHDLNVIIHRGRDSPELVGSVTDPEVNGNSSISPKLVVVLHL